MRPIFTGFEPVSSMRIYVNHSFNGIEPSTTLARAFLRGIWRRREGNDPSIADLESAVLPTTLTTRKMVHSD